MVIVLAAAFETGATATADPAASAITAATETKRCFFIYCLSFMIMPPGTGRGEG